jgi:hypothetical protein
VSGLHVHVDIMPKKLIIKEILNLILKEFGRGFGLVVESSQSSGEMVSLLAVFQELEFSLEFFVEFLVLEFFMDEHFA